VSQRLLQPQPQPQPDNVQPPSLPVAGGAGDYSDSIGRGILGAINLPQGEAGAANLGAPSIQDALLRQEELKRLLGGGGNSNYF